MRTGLNPTNKKSHQNFWISDQIFILDIVIIPKILGYYFQKSGQLAAPENWIQFSLGLSKKMWGFKIFRFIQKNWIWNFFWEGSSPALSGSLKRFCSCLKIPLKEVIYLVTTTYLLDWANQKCFTNYFASIQKTTFKLLQKK